MPVCSGSFTLSRCTIPGAFTSILRVSLEEIGPFRPPLAERVHHPATMAWPIGTSAIRPVRLTTSAAFEVYRAPSVHRRRSPAVYGLTGVMAAELVELPHELMGR